MNKLDYLLKFRRSSNEETLEKVIEHMEPKVSKYRNGEKPIPYGVWRKFLVITGRVKQEIYPVMGVFDILKAENN